MYTLKVVLETIEDIQKRAESLGLSSNTIMSYTRVWKKFFIHIHANNLDIANLGSRIPDIYERLTFGLGASGHLQVKAALGLIYPRGSNPFGDCRAPKFDIDKVEIRYLEGASMGLLLDGLSRENSYFGKASYVLASCLFFTARRFHEWAELNRSKLSSDLSVARLKVKGGKYIDIPLSKKLQGLLQDWLEYLDAYKGVRILRGDVAFASAPLLFPGRCGNLLSNRSFNLKLRRMCQKQGIPKITAHGLRHSAATLLLNTKGANLREVQSILGHKNLSTTARYTHVDQSRVKFLMDDLSSSV